MEEARKLKLSWQMKGLAVLLIVAPISTVTVSVLKQSSLEARIQAQQARGIASVTEEGAAVAEADSMDLSHLSAADLKKTFKYQLLRDVHATKFKDSINLSLGLFLVKSESGNKVYACDRYPQIQITIGSNDLKKVIESPCNISDDQNHIEATAINFESPENTHWKITDVKLLGEKKDDVLEINPNEIRSVLGQEIAIEEIR